MRVAVASTRCACSSLPSRRRSTFELLEFDRQTISLAFRGGAWTGATAPVHLHAAGGRRDRRARDADRRDRRRQEVPVHLPARAAAGRRRVGARRAPTRCGCRSSSRCSLRRRAGASRGPARLRARPAGRSWSRPSAARNARRARRAGRVDGRQLPRGLHGRREAGAPHRGLSDDGSGVKCRAFRSPSSYADGREEVVKVGRPADLIAFADEFGKVVPEDGPQMMRESRGSCIGRSRSSVPFAEWIETLEIERSRTSGRAADPEPTPPAGPYGGARADGRAGRGCASRPAIAPQRAASS